MSSPKSNAAAAGRKPRRTPIAAALASPAPGVSGVTDAGAAGPDVPVALIPAASLAGGADPAPVARADAPSPSTPPPAATEVGKVKHKLVRDSFTMPKNEYTVLTDLKQRAGRLGNSVKKSELLRAGVRALAAMPDDAFLSAVAAIPVLKTGRPKAKRNA